MPQIILTRLTVQMQTSLTAFIFYIILQSLTPKNDWLKIQM